jgi:imidazolonepropionase
MLVTEIAELVTNDPEQPDLLGVIQDAALLIEDGRVSWAGPQAELPAEAVPASRAVVDGSSRPPAADARGPARERTRHLSAGGRAVIPGFVDSHNHLVFAGDRSAEFAARMAGDPYSAGGIATTVAATREASEEDLEANLIRLLREAEHSGTTTCEIKTGYGLTLDDELRALRIINRHTAESTLMAAHVVPPEYLDNPDGYVDLVIEEIIPAAAGQAKWIDVFCEDGAFTVEQAERIIVAGKHHGMRPRLHAHQLTAGGALQLAARTGCASADHATFASDEDLAALAAAGTVVTLLPGVEFSTRQPYPDARRYFAAGATVAIASDCNPGSCFTNSIPFCIAVAVRDMHFTVEQAVWAATAGGAQALDRTDVGRLTSGARADFSILDAPSHRHLAYRPGVQLVAEVYRAGERIAANRPRV